jgi:malonyl CoA-acyl carrier protein transacylase
VGMLNDFIDSNINHNNTYNKIIERVDNKLYPIINSKLSDIMTYIDDSDASKKRNILIQTKISQPAIILHSILNYYKFMETINNNTYTIKYLFGPSLGEITSLVAAESLNIDNAAELLYYRGSFMQESCPINTGGMLNIVGDIDKTTNIFENYIQSLNDKDKEYINVSSIYSKRLLVISGRMDLIDKCIVYMKAKSIACRKLQTSAAFHSKLMEKGKELFSDYLQNNITFVKPKIDILSTIDNSLIYSMFDNNKEDIDKIIKDCLTRQFIKKIDLLSCINKCKEDGLEIYDLNKRKFIDYNEYL